MNRGLVKNYVAGGPIKPHSIVAVGLADFEVIQATAADDPIIGICMQPNGAAEGERVDIGHSGIVEVLAAGTIGAGAPVTATADGAAVEATPGEGSRVIGHAQIAASAGDIVPVLIGLSSI